MLGLPRPFGPGPDRPLELLSAAGSGASVRAVFVVRVGDDRYQPAVLLPRQAPRPLLVGMAALHRVPAGDGLTARLVGPRTIDDGRHRLVFPQPGAVVVLEVRSGRAHRFPVDDPDLDRAAWAADGRTIVAGSAHTDWLVDAVTGRAARASGPVQAGRTDLVSPGGEVVVRAFSPGGVLSGERPVGGPTVQVFGRSASGLGESVCRAGLFGEVVSTGGRTQGLVAVLDEPAPRPRLLAAPAGPDTALPAYRPLAWGPHDTVLLESRTLPSGAGRPVLRVLAWDVARDRIYRVTEVEGGAETSASGGEEFTGDWAL